MIKDIFKRSGIHFSGSIISKIFTSAVYITLSNYLNPSEYGQATLGVTVILLSNVFADYGLTQWYQRQEDEKSAFYPYIKLRIILAFLISLIIIPVTISLEWFTPLQALIIGLIILMHSLLSVATSYLIRNHQVFKPSLQQVVQAIPIILFIIVKQNNITVTDAFLGYAIGSLAATIIMFPLSHLKNIRDKNIPLLGVFRSSSKYALLNYTSVTYARADAILVRSYLGSAALGFYGLAYRYLEYFALFPSSLVQILFPLFAQNKVVTTKTIVKLTLLVGAIGLLFGLALNAIAQVFVIKLHGTAYAQSIPVLQVLSLTLVLFFVNAPLSTFVQASDMVKNFLPFGIVNTTLNVILNIVAIPRFGVIGAAGVMFITEVTGMLINVYFTYRVLNRKK